ncbi:MAG: hypothetical protein ACFCVC_02545 [Acidimicrobiia bacterium]
MEPFIVRRSAWRMWGVSLMGVPMVVVGLDLLTQRRLTTLLRDILFRPDDTQLPEPRETVWAVALVIVGVLVVAWGLKELLAPTKVVVADDDGLSLKVTRPFAPPLTLSWDQIEDIGSATVDDDGEHLPVLWIRTTEPGLLPTDGWGARPMDDRTMAVMAADWEVSHVAAADGISARVLAARAVAPEGEEMVFDPGILPDDPT